MYKKATYGDGNKRPLKKAKGACRPEDGKKKTACP